MYASSLPMNTVARRREERPSPHRVQWAERPRTRKVIVVNLMFASLMGALVAGVLSERGLSVKQAKSAHLALGTSRPEQREVDLPCCPLD